MSGWSGTGRSPGGNDRVRGVQVKGHGKEVSGRSIRTVYNKWTRKLKESFDPELTYAEDADKIAFGLWFNFLQPVKTAKTEDDR